MKRIEPDADVTNTVLEILGRVMDVEPEVLLRDSDLTGHAWTSLSTLEVLVSLESAFGGRIDLRQLHRAATVGDVIDLVTPPPAD